MKWSFTFSEWTEYFYKSNAESAQMLYEGSTYVSVKLMMSIQRSAISIEWVLGSEDDNFCSIFSISLIKRWWSGFEFVFGSG